RSGRQADERSRLYEDRRVLEVARPACAPRRTPLPQGSPARRGGEASPQVRIDRFLFFIRLLKSRTLAQALIQTGHVRIDGKRVEKVSEEVRVGSVVAFPLRDEVRILRVLSLPVRRGPSTEARACYEELGIDVKSPAS